MYATFEEMRLAIKHFTPRGKFSNKTLQERVNYFKQICAQSQLSDVELAQYEDEIGIPLQYLKRIAAGEDVFVSVSECNNPVEHIAYTVGMLVPIQNDPSTLAEGSKYRIQKINRETTVGWNCADYLEFKTSLTHLYKFERDKTVGLNCIDYLEFEASLNRYLNLLLQITTDGEIIVISKVDDPRYTAFETQQ